MFTITAVLSSGTECMRLSNFIPLKLSQYYSAATAQECQSLRFIICRSHMYLYSDRVVYPLNLGNSGVSEIETEKIEFHLQDDRIMCAAVCSQIPLFFSRTHGLVSVSPGDFDSSDFLNMSSCNSPDVFVSTPTFGGELMNSMRDQTLLSESNLYMYELDPDAMYNEFKDEVSQMKAAFVYHLKRNTNMSNIILQELLRQTLEGTQTAALGEVSQLDRYLFYLILFYSVFYSVAAVV